MLIKMLFLDYSDLESMEGFVRSLELPAKYAGNPIMVPDRAGESGRLSLFGSVIRRPDDGRWQMWYTTHNPELGGLLISYAESNDGIAWTRPELDLFKHGDEKTNILLAGDERGLTVICDQLEHRQGWRYKMLLGAGNTGNITPFRSPDGIFWTQVTEDPVISTNPDCPMSLHRAHDGRYVVYTRPEGGDRRIARVESWDFVHWSETRMVLEPGPLDPVQTQFYGLGSTPYGGFELGTLWAYHTAPEDMGYYKTKGGKQMPELAYCRSGASFGWPTLSGAGGYAWHRAAHGEPLIPLGSGDSWECGSVQAASSLVCLEDEIRVYYSGSRTTHGYHEWDGPDYRTGIGFASLKPDRFVALSTANAKCQLLTRPVLTKDPQFFVNANVDGNGELRVEITDVDAKPFPGFELENCLPITGASVSHCVRWRGEPSPESLAGTWVRLRVEATSAKLYTLAFGREEEVATYWDFRIPHHRGSLWEKLPEFYAASRPG